MIAGITTDNYKLPTFKKELKNAGFTSYSVHRMTDTTSVIKVAYTSEAEQKKLMKVCQKVQLLVKRLN